jgi:hypothetical protein
MVYREAVYRVEVQTTLLAVDRHSIVQPENHLPDIEPWKEDHTVQPVVDRRSTVQPRSHLPDMEP